MPSLRHASWQKAAYRHPVTFKENGVKKLWKFEGFYKKLQHF